MPTLKRTGANKRRMAVFRAGFDNLAVEGTWMQFLHLSIALAVMPDDHAFSAVEAAVFLHGQNFDDEGKHGMKSVVDTLKRWFASVA